LSRKCKTSERGRKKSRRRLPVAGNKTLLRRENVEDGKVVSCLCNQLQQQMKDVIALLLQKKDQLDKQSTTATTTFIHSTLTSRKCNTVTKRISRKKMMFWKKVKKKSREERRKVAVVHPWKCKNKNVAMKGITLMKTEGKSKNEDNGVSTICCFIAGENHSLILIRLRKEMKTEELDM
jgi:hypothetical protein